MKIAFKLVELYLLVTALLVGLSIVCQKVKGEVTQVKPPDNIVRVQVMEKDNLPAYGTGALLSERIVVTNNHVVRGRKSDSSIKVIFPDWTIHTAKVIHSDKGPDLAAIRLDEVTQVKPLIIGAKPSLNDVLHFWGYGSAIPRKAIGKVTNFLGSRGETRKSRKVEIEEDGNLLEINTTARNGDSGSPFLNERGEYVGTLFGSNDKSAYGSHVKAVLDFLGWEHGSPIPKLKTRLY